MAATARARHVTEPPLAVQLRSLATESGTGASTSSTISDAGEEEEEGEVSTEETITPVRVPHLAMPRSGVQSPRPQTAGATMPRCPLNAHRDLSGVVVWVRDDVRLCLDCGFAWLTAAALTSTIPVCHRSKCGKGKGRVPWLRIENHFGRVGYACISCATFIPLVKWTAHAKKHAKKMAAVARPPQ